LPAWDYPLCPSRKASPKAISILNPLLNKHVLSRWLDLTLFFFCESLDLDNILVHKLIKDWSLSWSINFKKNLANVKPSRPHTCGITHIYCVVGPSTTYAVCHDQSFGLLLGRSKAPGTTQQSNLWVSNVLKFVDMR